MHLRPCGVPAGGRILSGAADVGNKQRRQERMMRIQSGPTQAGGLVHQPLGLQVRERLSEHAVRLSDGSIQLEAAKFGAPHDVYEADFAWVERHRDVVMLRFAQGENGELDTRLTVKWSIEAFVVHLWDNSKDFFARLQARADKRKALIDHHRDADDPGKWRPDRRHQMTANFSVIAHAGNEACCDFFHLAPTGVARWATLKDGSGLVADPKVRVTLTTDELFRLLQKCSVLAEELRPLIADREAL